MFEQKQRHSGIYLAKQSHLKCVCHSVQEFNDKQWGDFSLDDREEEELAPVYGDEVVVWGLQNRGHILRVHCLLLRLEKVITHTPADDTLPMFLQEDVSWLVNQEQTVDHLSCNNEVFVVVVVSDAQCFWMTETLHQQILKTFVLISLLVDKSK